MQQSNVIFANLLIAYFLFITMKGELPQYIDLLRGGGQTAAGAAGSTISVNQVAQGAAALLNSNPLTSGSSQGGPVDLWQLPPPGPNDSDFLTQLTGGGAQ